MRPSDRHIVLSLSSRELTSVILGVQMWMHIGGISLYNFQSGRGVVGAVRCCGANWVVARTSGIGRSGIRRCFWRAAHEAGDERRI